MKSMIVRTGLLISSILLGASNVFAQPTLPITAQVPEKNGDYADPGHPGVRVRVFVHEPKEQVTTTTQAACVDPSSDAVTHTTGWHLPSSVTYRLNTSSVPAGVGANNISTIAIQGFAQWTGALTSISKPTFTQGANTYVNRSANDGQNVIAWGRAQNGSLAITYTRYYTSTGLVVDTDTIMNNKYKWSWNGNTANSCGDPTAYDAQNILTHEQGHWMGLNDEYTAAYVDNTMYGYGNKNEVKKDTITNGDALGVQQVYP